MNSMQETSNGKRSPTVGPLNNRRSLLKAAASVAPFVGTLPSGAALANASAAQCAIDQQTQAAMGKPLPEVPPDSDNYVRVRAITWFGDNPTGGAPIKFYQFTALDGTTSVRVDSKGNRFPIPGGPNPFEGIPQDRLTEVELLVLYQPADSPLTRLELDADGITPSTCTISSSDFSAPPGTYCIYPIAKLGQPAFGNIGMTTSCLASFAPRP